MTDYFYWDRPMFDLPPKPEPETIFGYPVVTSKYAPEGTFFVLPNTASRPSLEMRVREIAETSWNYRFTGYVPSPASTPLPFPYFDIAESLDTDSFFATNVGDGVMHIDLANELFTAKRPLWVRLVVMTAVITILLILVMLYG